MTSDIERLATLEERSLSMQKEIDGLVKQMGDVVKALNAIKWCLIILAANQGGTLIKTITALLP